MREKIRVYYPCSRFPTSKLRYFDQNRDCFLCDTFDQNVRVDELINFVTNKVKWKIHKNTISKKMKVYSCIHVPVTYVISTKMK